MTKKFYNPTLDYLRIFAMFAVLWVHISVYIDMPDSVRPLFTWGDRRSNIFCFEWVFGWLFSFKEESFHKRILFKSLQTYPAILLYSNYSCDYL